MGRKAATPAPGRSWSAPERREGLVRARVGGAEHPSARGDAEAPARAPRCPLQTGQPRPLCCERRAVALEPSATVSGRSRGKADDVWRPGWGTLGLVGSTRRGTPNRTSPAARGSAGAGGATAAGSELASGWRGAVVDGYCDGSKAGCGCRRKQRPGRGPSSRLLPTHRRGRGRTVSDQHVRALTARRASTHAWSCRSQSTACGSLRAADGGVQLELCQARRALHLVAVADLGRARGPCCRPCPGEADDDLGERRAMVGVPGGQARAGDRQTPGGTRPSGCRGRENAGEGRAARPWPTRRRRNLLSQPRTGQRSARRAGGTAVGRAQGRVGVGRRAASRRDEGVRLTRDLCARRQARRDVA